MYNLQLDSTYWKELLLLAVVVLVVVETVFELVLRTVVALELNCIVTVVWDVELADTVEATG